MTQEATGAKLDFSGSAESSCRAGRGQIGGRRTPALLHGTAKGFLICHKPPPQKSNLALELKQSCHSTSIRLGKLKKESLASL